MLFYVAASLLVVGVWASGPPNSGSGNGYGDPYAFTQKELTAAAEFAHRVANEKIFLQERLDMLKDEQQNLLDIVAGLRLKFGDRLDYQTTQNKILYGLQDDIKTAAHDVVNLEDYLAKERTRVDLHADVNKDIADDIHKLTKNAVDQEADIDKLEQLIKEINEKLWEKVDDNSDDAQNEIDEVENNSDAYQDVVNSQKCTTSLVEIEIDPSTAEGEGYFVFPAKFFGGNIPLAYCAAQGLHTNINLKKETDVPTFDPYTRSYKVPVPEPFDNLAFSVDCKAFADKVLVKAFDQSRGYFNSLHFVYVRVKACSFGPQDGPLKLH